MCCCLLFTLLYILDEDNLMNLLTIYKSCQCVERISSALQCLGHSNDLISFFCCLMLLCCCLDALAACNYLPQSREKIIAALFKALNSTNNELQEAGEACMRKVSAKPLILWLLSILMTS